MGIAELPSFEDRYYQMDGWVLVYSVTERRSFDVLSEIFDKLKVTINDKKHLPIVVVGNKIDLDGNRAVSVEEGRSFASSVRLPLAPTLALLSSFSPANGVESGLGLDSGDPKLQRGAGVFASFHAGR